MNDLPTELLAPASADIPNCWNEVGVYGTGSCDELRHFVHCRNCPVYARAGAQLLERPLLPEYRKQWAEHLATQKRFREPGKVSAVLFRCGSDWLALPTQVFQEVAERREIHSLPHRRHGSVLGLANIRGELLLCLSLDHLLRSEPLPTHAQVRAGYHRLLVLAWEECRAAFPVQEVHGPHRFHPEELKTPPATLQKSHTSFTQHLFYWRQRAVGLLDPTLVFQELNRSLI